MHDYISALQCHHRALAISVKLFGKEHESTADSYRQPATTQININTSQPFNLMSVHLLYQKIVEPLVFAWTNIVTHLFDRNLLLART